MAVTLSPPAPPTSLKRVNSDGTPTQAQLDYERAIAKWVADQINAAASTAIPFPTPATLGGVKSLAAVSHKFLTSIGTDGLPVAAQPSAGDISGLGPFATVSSIAVGSITGLGLLATLSSVDLGSQVTGNLAVSRLHSGIDASGSTFWRGDGIWAPVTASAGGSSGQIQFNSAGSLGGFTVSGDGTLDPVTGSLLVTKTNGVAFAAVATSGSATDLGIGTLPSARLPNPTLTTNGGVRQYNAIPNQYLTGISGFGVPFGQQPSVNDLVEGSTGNGAVVRADGPVITGSAVAGTFSITNLTASVASIGHLTVTTEFHGPVGTVGNLTVDVAVTGGTSTGTIATFKDTDGTPTRLLVDSVGSVPVIDFRQANGTSSASTASLTNDILGILAARGRGATGYNLTTASGAISFRAAENWTNTAQGSYLTFETTPIGSTTRAIQARINNDGKFGLGVTPAFLLDAYTSTSNFVGNFVSDAAGAGTGQMVLATYGATNASAGSGVSYRSARGSLASPSDVVLGDRIMAIFAAGYAGGAFRTTVSIEASVDASGTVSSTSLPTFLAFKTTPNGSVSRVEQARLDSAGGLTITKNSATPAGGTAGLGLMFGTTANFGTFYGSGAPTLSAAQGSVYMRSDGSSTSTRMYVNTNGSTGWTAVTTAS